MSEDESGNAEAWREVARRAVVTLDEVRANVDPEWTMRPLFPSLSQPVTAAARVADMAAALAGVGKPAPRSMFRLADRPWKDALGKLSAALAQALGDAPAPPLSDEVVAAVVQTAGQVHVLAGERDAWRINAEQVFRAVDAAAVAAAPQLYPSSIRPPSDPVELAEACAHRVATLSARSIALDAMLDIDAAWRRIDLALQDLDLLPSGDGSDAVTTADQMADIVLAHLKRSVDLPVVGPPDITGDDADMSPETALASIAAALHVAGRPSAGEVLRRVRVLASGADQAAAMSAKWRAGAAMTVLPPAATVTPLAWVEVVLALVAAAAEIDPTRGGQRTAAEGAPVVNERVRAALWLLARAQAKAERGAGQ